MLPETVVLDARAEIPIHSKGEMFLYPVTLQASLTKKSECSLSKSTRVASSILTDSFLGKYSFHSWDLNIHLPSRLKCQRSHTLEILYLREKQGHVQIASN